MAARRSLVLKFKDILRCIRCGACMNTSPCLSPYGRSSDMISYLIQAPVGAVLTPLLADIKTLKPALCRCSLCTACDSVCPVKIPLSNLIKRNIVEVMVEQGITPDN